MNSTKRQEDQNNSSNDVQGSEEENQRQLCTRGTTINQTFDICRSKPSWIWIWGYHSITLSMKEIN
jgi:hypothetical protein